MIRGKYKFLVVVIFFLIFWLARMGQLGATPPSVFSADQLIDSVANLYSQLKQLPGLEIEYRIDHEKLHKSSVNKAWKWGEYIHAIRPADLHKLYVCVRHPAKATRDPSKEVIETEVYSRDDDLIVRLDTSDEGGKAFPAAASLMRPAKEGEANRIPPFLFYYFHYLAFPVPEAPEATMPPRKLYPKDGFWLPEALLKNRGSYSLSKELEEVGGVRCHVLERPGRDRLWIQTEPALAIRRRQVWWDAGKPIREVFSFDDFVEVRPQLSLPRTIVVDYYAAPWDPSELHNKVCSRHLLRVSKLVAAEIPDSRFRAEIPKGALVDDLISSGSLTRPITFVNRPGEDPFARAVEALKHNQLPRQRSWFFIVNAIAGIFVILLLAYRRWRQRPAASS